MKADGSIVTCSRNENRRLVFARARRVRTLRRDSRRRPARRAKRRYRAEVESVAADRYAIRFAEKVDGATDIGMVYGRLCVVPGEKTFLKEALLTVFRRAPCQEE